MAVDKSPKISSDRLKWQKLYEALVKMLQTQQTQLLSLAKERKLCQDRIKLQYDRWVSDVRLLEGQISQMKAELSEAQMGRSLEVAKSELVVGLKQRESSLYKLKLESTVDDLEDLKLWFEFLTHKLSGQSGKSGDKSKESDEGDERVDNDPNATENSKGKRKETKSLEGEVNRLKRAYERLSSKNSSEVSALMSERNFVWNQLKEIDGTYATLLKSKNSELEEANEKIEVLLGNMKQLESVNDEKEEIIVTLKAKVAKLEADTDKNNNEVSRLSRELELLRNSKGALMTPVLTRCRSQSSSRSRESKSSRQGRKPVFKKESDGSLAIVKTESRSSRTRRRGASSVSEIPRLFSSRFKVPKLKGSSLLGPNQKRFSPGSF